MAEKCPHRCLSEDDFREIIGSACSTEQQDRYAAHLDDCETCRQELERFAGKLAASSARAETTPALSSVIARLTQIERSNATTGQIRNTVMDLTFPYLESSDHPESLGRLGKYEVMRQLGRGGMGVVFAAMDTSLDREVAIRIPSPSLTSTEEAHQPLHARSTRYRCGEA